MGDTEILAEAKHLIAEKGEDAAFRDTCMDLEAFACRGDLAGMEQCSRVLLAMCGLLGREGRTVH